MTRILRGLVATACLAVCAGVSAFAETDENGLTPSMWFKFNGDATNYGSNGATITPVGTYETVSGTDQALVMGGAAQSGGGAPTAYPLTVHMRAQLVNATTKLVWSFGGKNVGGINFVIAGENKIKVMNHVYGNLSGDLIGETAVDGATSGYHYFTYVAQSGSSKLYYDGKLIASSTSANTAGNAIWGLGKVANGTTYFQSDVKIADLRTYNVALTEDQIGKMTETPLIWGTAGWSGNGVATKSDGSFEHGSWTFKFSTDDHIVHDTIDTTKKVVVTKIRMMQRANKNNKPTTATLTQRSLTEEATSVTSHDDDATGMTLYDSTGTASVTRGYHEFIFAGTTEFDPTADIQLVFDNAKTGCSVMQPANSVMKATSSGVDWSPVIEITAKHPSGVADYVATIGGDTTFSGITTWEPSRPATGFASSDILEIDNTASAKLTMDESFTVKKLKIVNAAGNALTLDLQKTPSVTTWDFSGASGGVVFDASGLNGTELAKNAVAGAPYSHWLLKGTITGGENVTVTPPTMPSGYDVEKVIDSYGLRIVVTAPKTALFGSININFMGNQSKGTSDVNSMVSGLTTDVGAHPVVGTSWTDLESKNYSATVEKYVNSDGTLVTGASIPVTITQCANAYGSGAANNTIFHGYIDDGGSPIVQIGSIPFSKYRVIVYSATDSSTLGFASPQIGLTSASAPYHYGPNYRGDAGATVMGDSAKNWGNGSSRSTCTEGLNYVVSDVLEGDLAYVKMTRNGDGRGTIAAVQIVEVGKIVEDYKEYKATISSAGTNNLSSLTWTPSPFAPTASDSVKITIDQDVTGEVTINLDKSGMSVQDFVLVSKGDATITLTGNNPATIRAWDFSGTKGRVSFGFEADYAKVTLGTYPRIGLVYPYTGTITNGFEYLGTGNALTLTTITSGTVIIGGSGTLHGDLNIVSTDNASVTIGGKYTSPNNDVDFACSEGWLYVKDGADISVTSIHCYRDRRQGGALGHLIINGTLRVTSKCGSDVPGSISDHYGILFERDMSTTGMDVDINATGCLIAEESWIKMNGTTWGRCKITIDGGLLKARGINVGPDGTSYAGKASLTVKNGGVLQLAESVINQNNADFAIDASVLSAYSYNGSTGYAWTPNTTTVGGEVTFDLNGLNINVPYMLSGTDAKVVAKSETVGGTLTLAGSNTFEKGMSILSGATVKPGNAAAFGTGAIMVNSGATLDCNGFGIANSITMSGSGVSGAGALANTGTSVRFVADISLAGDTTIGGTAGITFLNGSDIDLGGNTLTVSGEGLALKLEGLTVANGATVAVAQGTLAASGTTSLGEATLTIAKAGILDLSASGSISCRDFACKGSVTGNRAELIVSGTFDARTAVTIPKLQLADGVTLEGTGLTVTDKMTMGSRLFVVIAASELQPTFRLAVVPENTVNISKNVTVNGTKDSYVMLLLGDKLILTKENVVLADVSIDSIVGWTNFEELKVEGRIKDFSGTATSGGKTNINVVISSQGGSVTTQQFEYVETEGRTFSYVLGSVNPGQTYEVTVFVTITDTYVYNSDVTKDAVAARGVGGWIYEDAETFAGEKEGSGVWYSTNGVARATGGIISFYAEDWTRAAEFQPTEMSLDIDYSGAKDLHFYAKFDCPGFYTYESYPVVQDGVSAAFTLVADMDDNCSFAVVSGGEWVVVPRTVFAPSFETPYDVLVRLDGVNQSIQYSVISDSGVVRLATCPAVNSKDVSLDLAGSGSVELIEGIGQNSNLARVGDEEFKNYGDAIVAAGGTNSIAPLWWSRYVVNGDKGKFRIVDPNGWLELIWQKWHHWGIEDGFYRYVSGNNWIEYADASGVVEGNDGGWLVTNEVGLAWIAEQATNQWFCGTVSVGTNLDLSSKNWTPIAQFSGRFDGQGYAITGLNNTNVIIDPLLGEAGYYFSGPSNDWGYTAYGLFASATNASFANMTFEDVAISNVADSTATLLGVHAGGDLSVSNVTVASGRVEGEGRAVAGVLTVGGNGDPVSNVVIVQNANYATIAASVANGEDGGNVAQILAGTTWDTFFDGTVVVTNNVGEGAFDVRVEDGAYAMDWYDSQFNWFDLPVCNFAAAVMRFTNEDGYRRYVEANDPDSVPIDPVYHTARMLADCFSNGADNLPGWWMDLITAGGNGNVVKVEDADGTLDVWETVVVDRDITIDLNAHCVYGLYDCNVFSVSAGKLTLTNGVVYYAHGFSPFVGNVSLDETVKTAEIPGETLYDRTVPLSGLKVAEGHVRIDIPYTSTGFYYVVDSTPTLAEDWTQRAYAEGTGSALSISVPAAGESGFYRVRITDINPAGD